MEFNDNKIKNLMQDNQQQLPPELNWENMKDGIFNKIHTIEMENLSIQKKKESKRRIIFYIFFVFSICMGLFITVYTINNGKGEIARGVHPHQHSKEKKEISIPTRIQTKPNQLEYCPESDARNKVETHNEKQGDTILLSDQDNLSIVSAFVKRRNRQGWKQGKSETGRITSRQPVKMKESNISAQNPDISKLYENGNNTDLRMGSIIKSETSTSDGSQQTDKTKIMINPVVSVNDKLSKTLLETEHDLSSSPFGFETFDRIIYIPQLNTPLNFIVSKFHFNFDKIKSRSDTLRSNIDSPHKIYMLSDQIIFEGGISFWNREYGSTKPENAQYEKILLSLQIQGAYVKQLNKGYFVMAGIQYQQLESKFQYNQILQNYNVILKDTIIHVLNNSLTGNQSIVRGDVELSVGAERRIIHYNTSRLVKASLAIGRSWRSYPWQADLYLGAGINALVHNQGRALFNNEIYDYSGTTNALFQNSWAFDAILGSRLQYFVNKNLGITAGFQYQKSMVNWSSDSAINSFPSLFGLQMGLSYSWRYDK